MAQVKRETAALCKIIELLKGEFVRTEGWNPSYFSTEFGNLSRVNLIGVIVGKEDTGLVLDDGTGKISLRSFDNPNIFNFNIGNFVIVIGRPRIYNEEKYVVPEIIKKTSHDWGKYRQLRLDVLRKKIKRKKVNSRVVVKEENNATNYFEKTLSFIRDLDNGEGADVEEVIKRCGFDNSEKIITKLIEEGEVFEIRPGKVKLLE